VKQEAARQALQKLRDERYDLVILDRNMPGMGGMEACRSIREHSDIGIVMLTVRKTEEEQIQALDAGADDYITKPFSMPQLLARLRANLRRSPLSPRQGSSVIQFGDVEVDLGSHHVSMHGRDIRLTPKQFDVLNYCDVAVDRIDQLAFLEHLPSYVLAREESAEVFDPHLLFEAVAGFVGKKAEFLAQEVIEPSNLVRIRDFKMGRQVRHSTLPLVAEPGRRRYLLPDFTDNGLINLDPVFEGIECVLQLLDEFVGQVRPSRRNARSLQVGDRTDPISPRLHGNRARIPPGRLGFLVLRLFLPELLPVCDPSRNELRELIG
jgi:ActR/RegA family two-component response regulator